MSKPPKSPIIKKRPKETTTGLPHEERHVHFEPGEPKTTSPFPEPPPALGSFQDASGTFTHTTLNPSKSVYTVPQPQPQPAQAFFSFAGLPSVYHPTYFNPQPHPAHPIFTMSGDYSNCVPPNFGLNFQPPVPDTTMGPIPHTYVPRHDGQAGAGGVYLVPSGAQPQGVTVIPIGGTQPIMVTQQPGIVQQPIMATQPVMMQGQPVVVAPASAGLATQPVQGMPAMVSAVPAMPVGVAPGGMGPAVVAGVGVGGAPVVAGAQLPPDVTGIGKTAAEIAVEQFQFAYENNLYEPQDFKPADDDPSRYYPVREVDGNWTQRNRYTIDNLGDCRWYMTDEGYFYAVRLAN